MQGDISMKKKHKTKRKLINTKILPKPANKIKEERLQQVTGGNDQANDKNCYTIGVPGYI